MNRKNFFKVGSIAALSVIPAISLPAKEAIGLKMIKKESPLPEEVGLLDIRLGDIVLNKETQDAYKIVMIDRTCKEPICMIENLFVDLDNPTPFPTRIVVLKTDKYETLMRTRSECGRWTPLIGIVKDPFRK